MYQLTCVLTCVVCDNQVTEKTTNPNFNDCIQEMQKKLEGKDVILSISLCPDCVKNGKEKLKREMEGIKC